MTDPGNRGFEFTESGEEPPAITSVDLAGPDSVTITLDHAPAGTDQRIRYAFTGTPGAYGGPTTGVRGNLRDSDATPSLGGYPLYNWCVTFDEPVP